MSGDSNYSLYLEKLNLIQPLIGEIIYVSSTQDPTALASKNTTSIKANQARAYLASTEKKFDAIFIDHINEHDLVTREAFAFFKSKLQPNGVLLIKRDDHLESTFTRQICHTLSTEFAAILTAKGTTNCDCVCVFAFNELLRYVPDGFNSYEAKNKGIMPYCDQRSPQNNILSHEWVRNWAEEGQNQKYKLQKFTRDEALVLSHSRVLANLNPWLSQLEDVSGVGIPVYILDSGLSINHSEFQKGITEGRIKTEGSNFDSRGHGTHLASLICGTYIGIAPGCELYALSAFDAQANLQENDILPWLEKLIDLKPKNKVGILNASFCAPKSDKIDNLFNQLKENNFICIAAAGNHNTDFSGYSPASNPNIISVGATDNANQKWAKSNYGEAVTINVLGQNIIGSHHGNNDAYFWMSGTSVSCALVSGIAALYFEKFPNHNADDFKDFLKTYFPR